MNNPILDINSLSVVFNTNGNRISALRDLSLSVSQGEIVAVVGESGCGKSVLCKTIMGLLPKIAEITDGSIRVNGKETVGLSDDEYCQLRGTDMSMVFQDPLTSLDPTYTIGSQIVESIRIHDKNISSADAEQKAVQLMKTVGIDRAEERIHSYPWMLSGGMRQRCVLAMALAQDPVLLIADEPTTALDVTVQAEILDLLVKLRDERNMSVLFITHDLGVVARVADTVRIMYAGKIIESGTAQEVLTNPVHPYTWSLLHALPAFAENGKLFPIPGNPPLLREAFQGDAFAERNRWALGIDYLETPPFFEVSETHKVATWLADERAPKVMFETASAEPEKPAESEQKVAGIHKTLAPDSPDAPDSSRKTILRVNNLSHTFRLGRHSFVEAVRNVSFDIRQGEVFSLVGESGSGKSTLARCILGLHKLQSGTIEYPGIEQKNRDIQFISQDPGAALDPRMTVRDLIAEPLEIHKIFSIRQQLNEKILSLLREVNVEEQYIDRYPPELSGGQKQRVSIARAYGIDPKLLVADEPLASLDVSIQAQIVELFASLRKYRDTAILFIAHDLSMVEFISDRIGVMYRGRMVELAPTKELFRAPAHPYTKALLSAVPIPDPAREHGRKIETLSETDQKALEASGTLADTEWVWTEISDGHFVLMQRGGGTV